MNIDDRGSEPQAVLERYARRVGSQRYSYLNPAVYLAAQERQRALIHLMADNLPGTSPGGLRVLEVGCGVGDNLLELLRMGFAPVNLVGVELISARVASARERLPAAVRIMEGDALLVPAATLGQFDLVLQSLVFSSLLANDFQEALAKHMWGLVAPGGAVLWYDFVYDNPANRDVRGVPIWRVRQLFPGAQISRRRVTLAPPLSRLACRLHPGLYALLNTLPFLRTHLLCWLKKCP